MPKNRDSASASLTSLRQNRPPRKCRPPLPPGAIAPRSSADPHPSSESGGRAKSPAVPKPTEHRILSAFRRSVSSWRGIPAYDSPALIRRNVKEDDNLAQEEKSARLTR